MYLILIVKLLKIALGSPLPMQTKLSFGPPPSENCMDPRMNLLSLVVFYLQIFYKSIYSKLFQ